MSNKALIVINDQSFTIKDVYDGIDMVLHRLNEKGDLGTATKVLNSLDALSDVSVKGKAKLLWGMKQWYDANKPSEEFSDYMEATTSNKKITVDRYINVWDKIENGMIPRTVQEKPMRELIPIALMLSQGYEPNKREWDRIDLAANPSELGEIIREIKGKKPRKSGLTINLERDGSLYAWRDGVRSYVGFLSLDDDENPDVSNAIERIINGANIIRK